MSALRERVFFYSCDVTEFCSPFSGTVLCPEDKHLLARLGPRGRSREREGCSPVLCGMGLPLADGETQLQGP